MLIMRKLAVAKQNTAAPGCNQWERREVWGRRRAKLEGEAREGGGEGERERACRRSAGEAAVLLSDALRERAGGREGSRAICF